MITASREPSQVQCSDEFVHWSSNARTEFWSLEPDLCILATLQRNELKAGLSNGTDILTGDFPMKINYLVRILCESWKVNQVTYKSCSFALGVDIVAILMSGSMHDDDVDGLSRDLRWKEDTYLTYCWHWGSTQIEDRISTVFSHQMIY